ncbi:MAG: ornithine carbamoyltransferase [Candidatus Nezhaarchaeales archaeon]
MLSLMIPSIRGRDFLTMQELTAEEVEALLNLAEAFKRNAVSEDLKTALKGKSIAMIFEKPSTRTRVSLEVAIYQLGGQPLYLSFSDLQLSRGEALADTARVLDRYTNALIARVYKHSTLEEIARYAEKPVFNALSDLYHPMQALADLLTIKERLGRLKGVTVAYVGDGGSNTCHSMLIACSKLGLNIRVGCPSRYIPHPEVLKAARSNAEFSGSKVLITEDPFEAVKEADVVYTDVFVSMGFEAEAEARRKAFLPKYQVNKELVAKASPNYVFMHCLPAHRGEEVVDAVIDDVDHSAVWDQAENRLHTAKALLASMV